jgi:hypothetical protein
VDSIIYFHGVRRDPTGRKGIIHPHLNPLPSRERKIKEKGFHRERENREGLFIG